MTGVSNLHGDCVGDLGGEAVMMVRGDGFVVGTPSHQEWDVPEQAQLTGGADRLSTP